MATEAQRRAKAKYAKSNVRQIVVRFYPGDEELYEWVKALPNMGGHIKQMLREEMDREESRGAVRP